MTVEGTSETLGPLACALLDPQAWLSSRKDHLKFLDLVSIRRRQELILFTPDGDWGSEKCFVPGFWVRKSSLSGISSGESSPYRTSEGMAAVGLQASRESFADFSICRGNEDFIRMSRPETDRLLSAALYEILRKCVRTSADLAAAKGLLDQIVAEPVDQAFRIIQANSETGPRPCPLFGRALDSPLFLSLILDAVFGTPILLPAPSPGTYERFDVSYVATQLWQTRTFKASLGVEPIGIEFEIPAIGQYASYEVDIEKPDGCEILGCQLRVEGPNIGVESVYIRKAPRRSALTWIREKIASRNVRFRSQDRTRFGRRLVVRIDPQHRFSRGAGTVWMSLERRSIRPAILGSGIVGLILIFVVAWTSGFNTASWTPMKGLGLTRYGQMVGASSSAVVTALIAPGALTSFLSRPSEHQVLAQLLRVVRLIVLFCASVLFGAAIFVAAGVSAKVFDGWVRVSLGIVFACFVFLLFAYRNCERLGVRPGPWSRYVVKRRSRRRQSAKEWLNVNQPVEQGETEPIRLRWKRASCTRVLWEGEVSARQNERTSIGCIQNSAVAVDRLSMPGERTTKESRPLPFGNLDRAVFKVRLNRISSLEPPNMTARLVDVDDEARRVIGESGDPDSSASVIGDAVPEKPSGAAPDAPSRS